MKKKQVIIFFVIGLLVLFGIFLVFYFSDYNKDNIDGVKIYTDKEAYSQGETINITVENNLDKKIFYNVIGGIGFWYIEVFENQEWKESKGFQSTDKDIGEECFIALYERAYPSELLPGSSVSDSWNQKKCLFGATGPSKSKNVTILDKGRYRLFFVYGFNISEEDSFKIENYTKAYSNEFIVE